MYSILVFVLQNHYGTKGGGPLLMEYQPWGACEGDRRRGGQGTLSD